MGSPEAVFVATPSDSRPVAWGSLATGASGQFIRARPGKARIYAQPPGIGTYGFLFREAMSGYTVGVPASSLRLFFRPLCAEDGPLLRRWLGDRELREFAGRSFLPRLGTRWTTTQDAQFVIVLREGGRPIGICGLYGISPEEGTAEVGILLGEKETWGHGYGPEALRVLLDHAYRDLGLTQVALCVHATNARAIRAYEKVGFVSEGKLRLGRWLFGRGVEILVMTAKSPVSAGTLAKGERR